jgi:hypothetical protein
MAESVSGAKLALSNNPGSTSRVPLQGTDFVNGSTDVVINYPSTGTPTLQWKGKIKKVSKLKKSGEAEVKQQLNAVSEKDKEDTTADVSITIGTTTVTVTADIYEE